MIISIICTSLYAVGAVCSYLNAYNNYIIYKKRGKSDWIDIAGHLFCGIVLTCVTIMAGIVYF